MSLIPSEAIAEMLDEDPARNTTGRLASGIQPPEIPGDGRAKRWAEATSR